MLNPSMPSSGTVGQPYSGSVVCLNCTAAAVFTVTGNLPPGLGLGPFQAQFAGVTVSGTPTTPGNFSFTIQVNDPQFDSSVRQASVSFNVTISGNVTITTSVILPNATVNQLYGIQLTAVGGVGSTYSWMLAPSTVAPNVLPQGLTLSATGVIAGTPTNQGIYGFDIIATDVQGNSATAHFELTVTGPIIFSTPSPLPTATINTAYSQPVTVTGGNPPFTFSITDPNNAPPGIMIASNGVIGGVPKSTGTYAFTIQATDKFQYSATKQYTVSVVPAGPLLQTTVGSLTFTANLGGDAPPPQSIPITAASGVLVSYTTGVDGGSGTIPQPSWINVTPGAGPAPAAVIVTVNQSGLQTGKYSATIHITVPGNVSQKSIDIPVTFNVVAAATQIVALPASLKFAGRSAAPIAQTQVIALTNPGGGGPLSFSVSIVGKSSWITLNQTTGRIGANAPATVPIFINTQGLKNGLYQDILQITSTASTVSIPITLLITDQGPVLGTTASGLRFQLRQGAGSSQTQSVSVLDLGDASTSSSWQADLVSGSDWLVISTPNGVSTPVHAATLSFVPGPGVNALAPGGHYALARVSDPNATNSPIYLSIVADVAPSSALPLPDPSPGGLFFTSASPVQNVSVFTSSTDPVQFQTSTYTTDGNPWLIATPMTGTASTSKPGQVAVSVSPGQLPLGVYYGSVNISANGALRTVTVTLVVNTAPVPHALTPAATANATCAPTKLVLTETGLVNNFSVPAGWPATLIAQVNDDCGNAVSTASVVAAFSNGDAPLTLRGDFVSNLYSATWQPGVSLPSMTITLRASHLTLAQTTQQYTGAVNQNSSAPPTLVPNGALHIFFNSTMAQTLGSGLAPGNVAQVYGSGMASTPSQTTVPLPKNFNGTFMLIGSNQAPLYYISDQLLNVQVPFELTPNREYSLIVSANGALTLPATIDVTALQPGVAQYVDGTVIAQVSGTTTLISASNPAKPGQPLTIYLAGMGATTPPVLSGQPTPLQLVPVNFLPTVTLDGQQVNFGYAGLTPTGIGLYQINLTVPSNARTGNLDLVISQNGVFANTTKLPVSN
jgi:uncharacterized protein (TIGR03437 family)